MARSTRSANSRAQKELGRSTPPRTHNTTSSPASSIFSVTTTSATSAPSPSSESCSVTATPLLTSRSQRSPILGGDTWCKSSWSSSVQIVSQKTSVTSRKAPTAPRIPHALSPLGRRYFFKQTALDRDCVKTPEFNLRAENPSRFSQSENQQCWRRLSEEANRENRSTFSRLAHVFPHPG
jgi:hypothetical protein